MENKVLVVDDFRETRESLTEILEKSGYEISVAEDGYDAVLRSSWTILTCWSPS